MDNGIRIISDREQKEYLPLCPAQVQKHTITEENGAHLLRVTIVPCTDRPGMECRLTVTYTDARRSEIGTTELTLPCGTSEPVECPENALYVHSRIEEVTADAGVIWSRNGMEPASLPEQEFLWQTDPLYAQIRRECEGIVNPVFRPDAPEGLWRCTCGQISLAGTPVCGRCGVEKAWLDAHFDPVYLAAQNTEYEEARAKNPTKKVVKTKSKQEEDRQKMIAVFGGIGAALVLVILLVTLIIPSIRYSNADKLLAAGEYDEAIAVFSDLGGFRDAEERTADAVYKKAQSMTGLSDVILTTSEESPWLSITEDGILSLRKDDYTGSWDHFIVPDMVDGIIVRELDKNFFLNCKDMVEVTLSDCLEKLGEQTFFNCEALTTVHFGANISTLGPRTFINCYSLREITIPDTVTKIGLRAFNSCTGLRKVTLGSGITAVPSYLFSCCYSLEEVVFTAPVTEIGEYAFSECPALTKVYYPGSAADWAAVTVGEENAALADAEVEFGA